MLGSIQALADQIENAWFVASRAKLPSKYKAAKDITVSGMGGSALGAHLIATGLVIKKPFQIVNDYSLPGYVGKDSLVILSSYSGNTEETLSCAREAHKRKTNVLVIAAADTAVTTARTRGALAAMAEKNKWPIFIIDPSDNPSKQPRMATGSSAFGLLGLMKAADLVTITDANVKRISVRLREDSARFGPDLRRNPAKRLAEIAERHLLIFVGAEHLHGACHVISNQVNENAKQLSVYLPLPEMNHHFLEGLTFPRTTKRDVLAIVLDSEHYHPKNARRAQLTADLLGKNGIRNELIKIDGTSALEETWLAIQLGSYMSFYLAMLHGIDPSPVPNVETFKRTLNDL